MKISAIVLVKNGEELIGDSLKSLAWTDEVVVVDNGSADKSIEIAQKTGAKIVKSPESSFSPWALLPMMEIATSRPSSAK